MSEDHANASQLAASIRETQGLTLAQDSVDTNIVFFDVDPQLGTAQQFARELSEANVHVLCESHKRVRALTHLDVSTEQVAEAGRIIKRVAQELSRVDHAANEIA